MRVSLVSRDRVRIRGTLGHGGTDQTGTRKLHKDGGWEGGRVTGDVRALSEKIINARIRIRAIAARVRNGDAATSSS